jgi:hypothetical protein
VAGLGLPRLAHDCWSELPHLRFTIPALAAGETISTAALSLQVTNATTNGPAIWRTSPTCTESTLT